VQDESLAVVGGDGEHEAVSCLANCRKLVHRWDDRKRMPLVKELWSSLPGLTLERGKAKVNNIEGMMSELVKSSVDPKRKLYRRDEAAATTPEGKEGPRISVHTCRLCNRAAAGDGAQVRHKADCALPRLQKAQTALREAWPEMFEGRARR
jgi:hypothetical protein